MSAISNNGRRPVRVSLVVTLKNEAKTVKELFRSISAQTRLPDELIIVDGGSEDDTASLIRSFPQPVPLELLVIPGANISAGRNAAIAAATHDVIAVTDGGCVLDPFWLEKLIEPMEKNSDVALVAGFYAPLVGSWFQGLVACATLPLANEIKTDRFMPSARSIAYRREVWAQAGGYPEWLEIGEDMYFNHAWRQAGVEYRVVPEAVVYWRQRSVFKGVMKQYFRYAEGDGIAGMYPERHLIRFATYGWLLAGPRLVKVIPGYRLLTLGAGTIYLERRWRRIPVFMRSWPVSARFAVIPAMPGMLAAIDAAKMAGYVSGRWRRFRKDVRP